MCGFAYLISLMIYQFGTLFTGSGFGVGTAAAVIDLAFLMYMLFRRNKYDDNKLTVTAVAAAR